MNNVRIKFHTVIHAYCYVSQFKVFIQLVQHTFHQIRSRSRSRSVEFKAWKHEIQLHNEGTKQSLKGRWIGDQPTISISIIKYWYFIKYYFFKYHCKSNNEEVGGISVKSQQLNPCTLGLRNKILFLQWYMLLVYDVAYLEFELRLDWPLNSS